MWADAVGTRGLKWKLGAVQRISALRIVSAYRTLRGSDLGTGGGPVCEHAGTGKDRDVGAQEVNPNRRRQTQNCGADEANTPIEVADTMRQDGKMDALANPEPEVLDRERNRPMDFYITQVFTGSFGAYLHKFKRRENAAYELYGYHMDVAQHAIFKYDVVVIEDGTQG